MRGVTRMAAGPLATTFNPASMCRPSRSTRTRFPHCRRNHRPARIIQPAKQTRDVLRKSSSAISGFRSLCGHEQRSTFSHRAQRTSLWNLSPGAGSLDLSRELRHPPARSAGPVTLNRRCGAERSLSGGIFQAVFRVPLRLYRGKNSPVTVRGMPARSAFGDPAGTSPAAAINPSTSPLWPRPTSTMRAPPGLNSRVASGAITR